MEPDASAAISSFLLDFETSEEKQPAGLSSWMGNIVNVCVWSLRSSSYFSRIFLHFLLFINLLLTAFYDSLFDSDDLWTMRPKKTFTGKLKLFWTGFQRWETCWQFNKNTRTLGAGQSLTSNCTYIICVWIIEVFNLYKYTRNEI